MCVKSENALADSKPLYQVLFRTNCHNIQPNCAHHYVMHVAICYLNTIPEKYVDTRVTIICLMFSKITRITLKKGRHFLENGLQNGGYNGMMYLAILFSGIYAPENLCIESTLEALCLLGSEIDVLLWKIPFGNGRHFVKWVSQCRIEWCDTFGNNFSEIYAPQNLYIESTLNALRPLVS